MIDIIINEPIYDFWGYDMRRLLDDLAGVPQNETVRILLNSPGGEVFTGLAIYNHLKRRGNVQVRVAGIAASMGSVIALAGDQPPEMEAGAMMMIHNASSIVWGNKEAMEYERDVLDKIDNQLADIYVRATGLDKEKVLQMMKDETYLTIDEAEELGFGRRAEQPLMKMVASAWSPDQVRYKMDEKLKAFANQNPEDDMNKSKKTAPEGQKGQKPQENPEGNTTSTSKDEDGKGAASETTTDGEDPDTDLSDNPDTETGDSPAQEPVEESAVAKEVRKALAGIRTMKKKLKASAPEKQHARIDELVDDGKSEGEITATLYRELVAEMNGSGSQTGSQTSAQTGHQNGHQNGQTAADLLGKLRTGASAPVQTAGEGDNGDDSGVYDSWNNLTGAEKTEFYRNNKDAIKREARRRAKA